MKQPMVHPDPENPDDPLYYKKYAMNIAPPDVYYFLPPRYETRAEDKKTQNDRRIHFGWDNITEYE